MYLDMALAKYDYIYFHTKEESLYPIRRRDEFVMIKILLHE